MFCKGLYVRYDWKHKSMQGPFAMQSRNSELEGFNHNKWMQHFLHVLLFEKNNNLLWHRVDLGLNCQSGGQREQLETGWFSKTTCECCRYEWLHYELTCSVIDGVRGRSDKTIGDIQLISCSFNHPPPNLLKKWIISDSIFQNMWLLLECMSFLYFFATKLLVNIQCLGALLCTPALAQHVIKKRSQCFMSLLISYLPWMLLLPCEM